MAKKKANPVIDPSLPFVEVEILGNKYKLCFNFRALAKAGAWLRQQGIHINLLEALPELDVHNVAAVLAGALHTFHPSMSYADVESLVDYDTVTPIINAMMRAWVEALPPRVKGEANPPEAAPDAKSGQSPNATNGEG